MLHESCASYLLLGATAALAVVENPSEKKIYIHTCGVELIFILADLADLADLF